MSKKTVVSLLLAILVVGLQVPKETVPSAAAAPAAQTPTLNLPRDRVILTAEAYRRCMWYCAANNMGTCAGYSNTVAFSAGQVYEGVVYRLTGWDSLATFETR